MSRPTAGISINGRAPGWESSRTSRPANNSCPTFASSSKTWPRRVSHRKPSATTWTTSGALAARSSATCTMTKLFASFPRSGSSDSLSMNLVVPPFTTAQRISSVPSTPLAASCIGSWNADPRIPQTSQKKIVAFQDFLNYNECMDILRLLGGERRESDPCVARRSSSQSPREDQYQDTVLNGSSHVAGTVHQRLDGLAGLIGVTSSSCWRAVSPSGILWPREAGVHPSIRSHRKGSTADKSTGGCRC